MREYVEGLFTKIKDQADKEEYTVFNIYTKAGTMDVNGLEITDVKVEFSNAESVKKFLDRTTREALEGEVKGLKLIAMVLEKSGQYFFSSEIPLEESFKEGIKERIEQLKEE